MLHSIGSIELPKHVRSGGFDHAAIHGSMSRLYVAHTANDALDIIDCATGRYLRSVPDLAGIAGALVSEERNLVFTSNRGEDTVGIFAPGDEDHIVKIPVGMRPNGLAFDPQRGLLLAANVGDPALPGSFTLSIVDIAIGEMVCSIPVPGRTRWAVFDPRTDAFYVNIADPAQIVVVEAARPDRIARTFAIPSAGPHGLDLDASHSRLFCACDASRLVSIAIPSGEILGVATLSGAPDVVFFNAALHHLYVAIGDPGVIDVFDTIDLRRIASLPTGQGAHTLAFDAARNRVYAFLPHTHQAAVFVDESSETGRGSASRGRHSIIWRGAIL